MLYLPVLCNGFGQSSTNPPLLGSPTSTPALPAKRLAMGGLVHALYVRVPPITIKSPNYVGGHLSQRRAPYPRVGGPPSSQSLTTSKPPDHIRVPVTSVFPTVLPSIFDQWQTGPCA